MRAMRPIPIRTYCSNTSLAISILLQNVTKKKQFSSIEKKILFGAMKMGRAFGVAFRLYFVSSLCSWLCVVLHKRLIDLLCPLSVLDSIKRRIFAPKSNL